MSPTDWGYESCACRRIAGGPRFQEPRRQPTVRSAQSWREVTARANLHVKSRNALLIRCISLKLNSFAHALLTPWRGRSSGRTEMVSVRAGLDTWTRRPASHTDAPQGNWYGTGTAGRSSFPATA
jgi:hypothetical protein